MDISSSITLPENELGLDFPSKGIKVTSHDHNHDQNTSRNQGTSRRRASTLIPTSKSDDRGSKHLTNTIHNNSLKDSALIPSTSTSTSNPNSNSKPNRPAKSPFRPKFPSISSKSNSPYKRNRLYSFDNSTPSGDKERKRNDSELSIGGLEYLRNILSSFRQSPRVESQQNPPTENSNGEEFDTGKEIEEYNTEKRKRTSTFGITQEKNEGRCSRMSLSDQRSTQRLIDELMEDITPRSPTGSFHSISSPSYFPKRVHSNHRERIIKGSMDGHRRVHSSPGKVPTLSAAYQGDSQSERGRTLSGGTFGKPLSVSTRRNMNIGGEAESLISNVETLKNGNRTDGTASAPISPISITTPLPPVQLPFIAARRSNKSPQPEPTRVLESNSNPQLQLDPALPHEPKPFPTQQLPTPPPLSTLPTPLWIHSPPLVTPPEDVKQGNFALLPPPTSPLPPLPTQAQIPPQTPSSRHSSIRNVTPETHPFAVVVAMMEAGDSPTKRRSRSQLEKGSQEVLKTPTRKEKGKQREEGERPDVPSQGRKQTPRRGFIGPGGIIPRIASKSSLAKLKLSQNPIPTAPRTRDTKPVIISIPPSPPDTAKLPSPANNLLPPPPETISPVTPNSTTYLRPAPATPLTPFWSKPRFAISSSSPSPYHHERSPSPSPVPSSISRQATPIPIYAPRSGRGGLPPGPGSELVEIPRFKKKELKLGIVRRRGLGQRLAWLFMVFAWLLNGLMSLFFDVNVIYILVQCTTHPSFGTNSTKSWQFATAAYAVLWAISTLAIWIGWEVGYEFWRRWRLPRPAVEPIYSSLPASLHLSLISFNHFTFLLHIRTSPLNTPYSRDIIPETCYALIQLIPGLLPLLPRAAIAVVILISFWDPAADVQAPYGGAVDQSSERDSNFFKSDSPGQLTNYAKGVLITFTAWVALRLSIVIGSGVGIWVFSGRPLGGLIGHQFSSKKGKKVSGPPTTPRKPKSSLQPRDPSTTSSPQKSWVDQENEFNWAWRERTRSRIQDAFELCMIRRNDISGSGGRLNSFLYQSEIPWGRMINKDQRSHINRSEDQLNGSHIELDDRSTNAKAGPSTENKKMKKIISAGEFIESFVEGKDLPSITTTPERNQRSTEPTRPESMLDPTSTSYGIANKIHASPSRANTAASSSATDLFYTPYEGNTPQTEKSRSVAEGILKLPTQIQPSPSATIGGRNAPPPPPPSSFKPGGMLSEFGVTAGHISEESRDAGRGEGRGTPDSGSGEGDDESESTGLLTNSTSASPKNSIKNKNRNRSTSNTSEYSGGGSSSDHHHSSGVNSRSSSFNRNRAYTTSISPSRDSLLRRTRSSSITLLRESVTNAANISEKLIRRARSGTVLSNDTGYSRMDSRNEGITEKRLVGDSNHVDQEPKEEEEEILDHGTATTRGTNIGSGLGLGLGLGLPFAVSEKANA